MEGISSGAQAREILEKFIIQIMMENNVKMTFGSAYETPEVQVTEVLVEQGFQASLGYFGNPGVLDYSKDDFNEFE